ncbi:hypothetical protein WS88_24165 [Burkholderia cepacia]|nr:hypothetical protein WS88_24165 [Burkholderia cepacia]
MFEIVTGTPTVSPSDSSIRPALQPRTLHLSRQIASASKVIIVAGASQGIGAETVNAFRARGHRVVATSRSIGPSNDPDLVTVAGDIGDPA